MMAGPGGPALAGGGPARHIPVMLEEVLAALDPQPDALICDATFGAGGYSRAILEAGADVVAIDRDPTVRPFADALQERHGERFRFVAGPFSRLDELAGASLDGVVLDIGVSSMQIDAAERGFSFTRDGPLDMRMASAGVSAADVVNRAKAGDLARIFGLLGEERNAGRIARMIEKRRAERPFATTGDLAGAIEAVAGGRREARIHPATRVFQALRIFVNDELGELARALLGAERALKSGGRLVVVTFHSLEDRIVKRFIRDRSEPASTSRHLPQAPQRAATFERLGGPVTPGEAEIAVNPRARSARLRAARRTGAPARDQDLSGFGLPTLPPLQSFGTGA